jgi:hypothetical protein
VRGMRGGALGLRGPAFRPRSSFWVRPIYRRPIFGLRPLFWGMGLLLAPVLGVLAILAFALLRLIVR